MSKHRNRSKHNNHSNRSKHNNHRDSSVDNTPLIIGFVLVFIIMVIMIVLYLNSSKPVTKSVKKLASEESGSISSGGSSATSGSSSNSYSKSPEEDINTNVSFIAARDKLKMLYEGTSTIKLNDADKTAILKQIDYSVDLDGNDKPSSVLVDDVYDKSIYNLLASLDVRNKTITSTSSINTISNQLDLINGKENVDFIILDNIQYEHCSKDVIPQTSITGKEVCKLDRIPAVENFDLYNSLIKAFKDNKKFTSGEKNSAALLLHKAINYGGYKIDLQDKIKSCSDIQIYGMLLSNSVEEIINRIPSEYVETDDVRFIGKTNNTELFNKKCVQKYNDLTDLKTGGNAILDTKFVPVDNTNIDCKLQPLPKSYMNDMNYNKIMYKYEYKNDWTDDERNTAITIAGIYYNELKKTIPNLPDPHLQGRSNKELYKMLLVNNVIDYYNASNEYYMSGGMKNIDWMNTSDPSGCAFAISYINSDGTLKENATDYIINDDSGSWCKIANV